MPAQKITPFLWYDSEAEDATGFYTSIFPNSKILGDEKYEGKAVTEVSGKPEGSVMVVEVELEGQHFTLLNGGPEFKSNESVSFVIHCKDQEEVDYYWEKLTSDGGQESVCGWLKDKFGISWQVVPNILNDYITGPDKAGAERAMEAMLKMQKLNIAELQKAYEGE